MFEHDAQEGVDRIIPAKKHLFMLNNLFNLAVHLRGRINTLSAAESKMGINVRSPDKVVCKLFYLKFLISGKDFVDKC